jgi:hypothetical protein
MEVRESGDPESQHRRRRLSIWQKTPNWMKITLAVCLGLVLISIRFWSEKGEPALPPDKPKLTPGQAFDQATANLPALDLELSGTSLNPKTRRIEGTVLNKSDKTYLDVKILFALPSSDFTAQDQTTVSIPRLEPKASARFSSDVLPKDSHEWALINTTGTPVRR